MPERIGAVPAPSEEEFDLDLHRPETGSELAPDQRVRVQEEAPQGEKIPIKRKVGLFGRRESEEQPVSPPPSTEKRYPSFRVVRDGQNSREISGLEQIPPVNDAPETAEPEREAPTRSFRAKLSDWIEKGNQPLRSAEEEPDEDVGTVSDEQLERQALASAGPEIPVPESDMFLHDGPETWRKLRPDEKIHRKHMLRTPGEKWVRLSTSETLPVPPPPPLKRKPATSEKFSANEFAADEIAERDIITDSEGTWRRIKPDEALPSGVVRMGVGPDAAGNWVRIAEPGEVILEPEAESPHAPEKPPTPGEAAVSETRSGYADQHHEFAKRCKPLKPREVHALAGAPAEILPMAGDLDLLGSEDREAQDEALARQNAFLQHLTRKDIGLTWDRAREVWLLEARKRDYDLARIKLGRELRGKGVSEPEIFQQIIVQEQLRLQRERIEGYPPKEKGVFRKGLEWWNRRHLATKVFGSTLAITAAGVGFGFLGAASAPLFLTNRVMRGLIGAGVGQAAGKTFGLAAEKISFGIKRQETEYTAKNFRLENFAQAEKFYNQACERYGKRSVRAQYIKMAIMVAAGVGTSQALAEVFAPSGAETAAPVSDARPAPPEAPAVRVIAETPLESSAPEIAPPAEPAGPPELPSNPETQPAPQAPAEPPSHSTPEDSPAAESSEAADKLAELTIVGKGKGIWHAVYRQLEAQLGQRSPDRFGLSPEDLENPAKVKEVLNRETLRILRQEGMIKPDGTEMWVAEPGTKVVLDPDGHLQIEGRIYEHNPNPQSPPLERVNIPDEPEIVPVGEDAPAGPPAEMIRSGTPPELSVPEPTHPLTPPGLDEGTPEAVATTRPGGGAVPEGNNAVGERIASVLDNRPRAPEANNAVGNLVASILEPASERGIAGAAEFSDTRPGEIMRSIFGDSGSFTEAVPNREAFRGALEHQLQTHLGREFSSLPDAARRDIAAFIEMRAQADPRLLGANLDQLSGRTRIDFGRLFADRAFLAEALAFPRETALLESLGFHPAQILGREYALVLRDMPVSEYLSRFSENAGESLGKVEEFGAGNTKAHVTVSQGHVKLAEFLRQHPDAATVRMPLGRFLLGVAK